MCGNACLRPSEISPNSTPGVFRITELGGIASVDTAMGGEYPTGADQTGYLEENTWPMGSLHERSHEVYTKLARRVR